MVNNNLCNLNVGDIVLIPYDLLAEPFRGDSKERRPKRAVVFDKTSRLLFLRLQSSGQVVSYRFFDCNKLIPLKTEERPAMFDEKQLMGSLKNIQ